MKQINYTNTLGYALLSSDLHKVSVTYQDKLVTTIKKEGMLKHPERYARDLSNIDRLSNIATGRIKLGIKDKSVLLPILNLPKNFASSPFLQIWDGFQAKQLARQTSYETIKSLIKSKARFPQVIKALKDKRLNLNILKPDRVTSQLYQIKLQTLLLLVLPYIHQNSLSVELLDQTSLIQIVKSQIDKAYHYLNITDSSILHLVVSNYQKDDADVLAQKFNQLKKSDNYHIVVLSLLTTYQLYQGTIDL